MFAHTIVSRAVPAAPATIATTLSRACTRPSTRTSTLFAMPLRAKLLSQQQQPQSQRLMSTQEVYDRFKPRDGDEPEDVIFNSLYGLRSIELNRPRKLNALNGSMIRKIAPRMLEWAKSDMANVIVMKGAGDKAFCAGGDVAQLAGWNQSGPEGQEKSKEYFAQEYQLDHLIATYNKPYVAFMDGITMGGGVGLSIHAPFRIATERTVFAMPETTIGFFPDVGASFFLPRMPGFVGTYLALTSMRLMGANVFYSGVATHYLHSTSLPRLESRLAELRFQDNDGMQARLTAINATIEEFVTGLPHDEPILLSGELRRAIDRCFSHNSVDEILRALEKETGATRQWAQETISTLHERSPTAVHVALRQMRIGAKWSIRDTFVREYAIASKFMASHDFTEGVTALLVDKRPPTWQPPSLVEISPEQSPKLTEDYFLLPRDQPKLELLTDANYEEYPHPPFGVPTEEDIEKMVRLGTMTRPQLVDAFVKEKGQKQGVKEVVEEILARKTTGGSKGPAKWVY
ncbi:ClpP/crotonase-like domain-containing protein [Chaetomium fimeti]|uniref:3-hydroxyisobutyryl-CoA hydrolase n=1 Tax=Chaetomium fimeti TaxID=1854472 RepID=A0AAE0HI89_9PEZI|nr:ClpP/crotonase-like domain-containing protein [Chaetomium fimeti]